MSGLPLGVFFATVAACSWATGAIFARLGMQKVPAAVGTFVSLATGFLIVTMVTLTLYGSRLWAVRGRDLLWFLLLAMVQFPVGRFLNYNGIRLAGVSTGTAITGSSPLFAALLAAGFLGESLTLSILLGTVGVVLGLSMVMAERTVLEPQEAGRPTAPGRLRAWGILSALGGAVAYGAGHALARFIVTTSAPAPVTACYTLLFGTLAMFSLSARKLRSNLSMEPRSVAKMAAAGVFSSFGIFFMYLALSQAPVTVVSPISALYPLAALLLTHLFLKRLERVTFRMVCGASLIVLGVALVVAGGAG